MGMSNGQYGARQRNYLEEGQITRSGSIGSGPGPSPRNRVAPDVDSGRPRSSPNGEPSDTNTCIPTQSSPLTLSAQFHRLSRSNLSTLAILEHKNQSFLPASLSALTAASRLGSGQVTALLTGTDAPTLSSKAAKLAGVAKVLVVPSEAYDRFLPENFASLIAEAARSGGFTHVVAAHGQFGKNTIPRVGAILDVQPIADIIDIEGEDTFVRQIYAGMSAPTFSQR